MPVCINYKAGVSAQLKSAVMLAGLNSFGTTEIIEVKKSRDHTENMLIENSKAIRVKKSKQKLIKIFGKENLNPINIVVPGDPSSAAFFKHSSSRHTHVATIFINSSCYYFNGCIH